MIQSAVDMKAQHEAAADQFADLVARQSRFAFRVAYAIVRNFHDAEDVVQETFLRLYRGGAWKTMRDERAFIARTAWRLAANRQKRARAQEPLLEAACSGRTPEMAAVQDDLDAAVHRFVDALPEELRQPIALSTVDGLTSREIGEAMGIPEGTVRTRLMRARQILREKLRGLYGE